MATGPLGAFDSLHFTARASLLARCTANGAAIRMSLLLPLAQDSLVSRVKSVVLMISTCLHASFVSFRRHAPTAATVSATFNCDSASRFKGCDLF